MCFSEREGPVVHPGEIWCLYHKMHIFLTTTSSILDSSWMTSMSITRRRTRDSLSRTAWKWVGESFCEVGHLFMSAYIIRVRRWMEGSPSWHKSWPGLHFPVVQGQLHPRCCSTDLCWFSSFQSLSKTGWKTYMVRRVTIATQWLQSSCLSYPTPDGNKNSASG